VLTGLSGQVVITEQPQVFAPRQSKITFGCQRLMFLFSQSTHPFADILNEMKPIKHHFLFGSRHIVPTGLEKDRQPHVEANFLYIRTALRPESLEIARQAFFRSIFTNIFHHRCFKITNWSQYWCPLALTFLSSPICLGKELPLETGRRITARSIRCHARFQLIRNNPAARSILTASKTLFAMVSISYVNRLSASVYGKRTC
jgi:hypothetical protein